jgi:hypothetical protein
MGIHPNGVPISDFKPSSYVTRADFWTAFSRLLRGHTNETTDQTYWVGHLKALKNYGIVTNDTPTLQEARGRIFLQFYRAANANRKS